ncbi:hypothetical protein C7B70_25450, partial [Chlorogloea sp. CCALA 695]
LISMLLFPLPQFTFGSVEFYYWDRFRVGNRWLFAHNVAHNVCQIKQMQPAIRLAVANIR